MSQIWPYEVFQNNQNASTEKIRPFKCLLLMPFKKKFNIVAEILKDIVEKTVNDFLHPTTIELPQIVRLDWVKNSDAIQNQIWQEIIEADLVFCDITGLNSNVLFELGVCSAWKKIHKVILIKDKNCKEPCPFDIAPFRYHLYSLNKDSSINAFKEMIKKQTLTALISYPDSQGYSPRITSPLSINFEGNHDDFRIFTPPFAHRRITNDYLEFGSRYYFPGSWATLGKEEFYNFSLEFSAKFINPLDESSKIGVGLRSQHYYANYSHCFVLQKNGDVWMTEPNDEPPVFANDVKLFEFGTIDMNKFNIFKFKFFNNTIEVDINDFHKAIDLEKSKKEFGKGFIRFLSVRCIMAIKYINFEALN